MPLARFGVAPFDVDRLTIAELWWMCTAVDHARKELADGP